MLKKLEKMSFLNVMNLKRLLLQIVKHKYMKTQFQKIVKLKAFILHFHITLKFLVNKLVKLEELHFMKTTMRFFNYYSRMC